MQGTKMLGFLMNEEHICFIIMKSVNILPVKKRYTYLLSAGTRGTVYD
jgi:hypothetical protein